jgi:predicted nucleotidyltransferase
LSLSAPSRNGSLMTVHDLEIILTNAVLVARRFGAKRLLLFGSALENPAAAHDLDLACAGVPGWKLFELSSALEETLGVPLDLVPLDSPTPFTRLIEKRARVLL